MRKRKSILIIGASGFLGTHLAYYLRDGYKVFATYHIHPISIPGVTSLPMDISDRNWIKRLCYTVNPEVIIYAAGRNSMEWAETNPRDAERFHSAGPASVSIAAEILQPRTIYLSNPYVFDGRKGNYHEEDIVLPATVLGKVKLNGENFIRGKSLNYLIVRSAHLYGRSNGVTLSFFDRLRMNLEAGKQMELSTLELHSFAPIYGFVELVGKLIDSSHRNKIIHHGGLTKVNLYEFARKFAHFFGYDEKLIQPARMSQFANINIEDPSQPLFDYSVNSTFGVKNLNVQPLLLEEGFDLLQKRLVPSS